MREERIASMRRKLGSNVDSYDEPGSGNEYCLLDLLLTTKEDLESKKKLDPTTIWQIEYDRGSVISRMLTGMTLPVAMREVDSPYLKYKQVAHDGWELLDDACLLREYFSRNREIFDPRLIAWESESSGSIKLNLRELGPVEVRWFAADGMEPPLRKEIAEALVLAIKTSVIKSGTRDRAPHVVTVTFGNPPDKVCVMPQVSESGDWIRTLDQQESSSHGVKDKKRFRMQIDPSDDDDSRVDIQIKEAVGRLLRRGQVGVKVYGERLCLYVMPEHDPKHDSEDNSSYYTAVLSQLEGDKHKVQKRDLLNALVTLEAGLKPEWSYRLQDLYNDGGVVMTVRQKRDKPLIWVKERGATGAQAPQFFGSQWPSFFRCVQSCIEKYSPFTTVTVSTVQSSPRAHP